MITPPHLAAILNHYCMADLAEDVMAELVDQDSTFKGVVYILVKYSADRAQAIRELQKARAGLDAAIMTLNGMNNATGEPL
jgi:hypothetical protein